MTSSHFLDSSFREKKLEHIFIGDCLRRLWVKGIRDVEMLRADVDGASYDLVVAAGGTLRHIQLKASYNESKVRKQPINAELGEKPSDCVIWMGFDPDTIELGPFFWFGGPPGAPLLDLSGFKKAEHTKANAKGEKTERRNSYELKRTACERLDTLDKVIDRLFGIGGSSRVWSRIGASRLISEQPA